MSVKTRLTALICCLFVILGCLVSCNQNKTDDNPSDGNDLQTDRYVATVTTKFATNDNKMKEAISAAGATVSVLTVDGDHFILESSSKIDNVSLKNNYTFLGGMMYHERNITVGDKNITKLEKANMSWSDVNKILSDVGVGAGIGREDFSTEKAEESDNYALYTCSDIKDESKESLCNIFADKFSMIDATVTLGSAGYTEEIVDGRISETVLSCNFIINIDGVDYEITMHTYYEYNYEAEVSVHAPANVSEYTEVLADKIFE